MRMADDRKGLRLDICENGIKHAAWELSSNALTAIFFARHPVRELMAWTDSPF